MAKTLQSIAEFTIVEASEPEAHADVAQGERRAYQAPRVTPGGEHSALISEPLSTLGAGEVDGRSAGEVVPEDSPTAASSDERGLLQAERSDDTPGAYTVEGNPDWDGAQRVAETDEPPGGTDVIGDADAATGPFDGGAPFSERTEGDPAPASGDGSGSTEEGSEPADWRSKQAPALGDAFGGSSGTEVERVASCLEDVARSIREGGLHVPSLGPTSGQPAVLAAVLAAMLQRGE